MNEKKQELGLHRPLGDILDELAAGGAALAAAFGARALPCLVPPWNRIADGLLAYLPALGFRAVSCYGPRKSGRTTGGLLEFNTHVDIIDFRGGRGFRGVEACVEQLRTHLEARRHGKVDAGECTGLLTHHLDHDEACWEFCIELFDRLGGDSGVCWLSAEECLAF